MTYINCIIKYYNKIYRVIVFYVIIRTFNPVTVLGFRLKKSAFLTVDVFFNISLTLLPPLYFSHFSSPSVCFFYFHICFFFSFFSLLSFNFFFSSFTLNLFSRLFSLWFSFFWRLLNLQICGMPIWEGCRVSTFHGKF